MMNDLKLGMMVIIFRALTCADKPLLDKFYRSGYYENAHFNFTNLFMWRHPFNIELAEEDGVLFQTCRWNGQYMALQPIALAGDGALIEAVDKLKEHFAAVGDKLHFSGVEKKFADFLNENFPGDFAIDSNRDDFDYVYRSEDLIKLAGRKYHSKKNHLNAFYKNFPLAEYMPITDEIVTLCKLELNGWYKQRLQDEPDDPFIKHERQAIIEVLNNFSAMNLKGGAIRLNGRIIAFTFGEQLNDDTAVIHVEKADPNIRGAYPAINQNFVEHEWAHLAFINREEDMGIEGLRKAKESYKPVKLVEKFHARLL